jgi:hypothetical protein
MNEAKCLTPSQDGGLGAFESVPYLHVACPVIRQDVPQHGSDATISYRRNRFQFR